MAVSRRTSVAFLLAFTVTIQAADKEPSPEERVLREAGLATDGPALLAYLKAQTPSASERKRLVDAVAQLGHRSFTTRDRATRTLVAAGRPALPLLRPALANPDLEVSRRAERIAEEIERISYSSLLSAVTRVLAEKRPAGTVEAFLTHLPFVEDDQVEEAIREGLCAAGLEKGSPHPAIRAALSDPQPRLRAAAAFVLGRAPVVPVRELTPLLRDQHPEVRFVTAEAVLRGRDRAGIPVLVSLLEEAPLTLGRRVEETLFHLAGDSAPSSSLGVGDDPARRRCREAWASWWTARGEKIDLSRFQVAGTSLGVTLYCLYDSPAGDGRVVLAGPDGKTRWEIGQLQGPNDAHLLPGGRVLISERNAGKVTERDSTGRILWEKRVEGGAVSALRLPGGNTVVASWTTLLEVSPTGKTVWEYNNATGFRHCCRAPSGHVLAITASGQLLEVDRTGKLLRTITPERHGPGAGYWGSVEAVSPGRFLVAFGSTRKIAEIDELGKIAWETEIPSAVFATRLPNGHTLVCSFEECQVTELDRRGKEVSRHKTGGRPFTARKY